MSLINQAALSFDESHNPQAFGGRSIPAQEPSAPAPYRPPPTVSSVYGPSVPGGPFGPSSGGAPSTFSGYHPAGAVSLPWGPAGTGTAGTGVNSTFPAPAEVGNPQSEGGFINPANIGYGSGTPLGGNWWNGGRFGGALGLSGGDAAGPGEATSAGGAAVGDIPGSPVNTGGFLTNANMGGGSSWDNVLFGGGRGGGIAAPQASPFGGFSPEVSGGLAGVPFQAPETGGGGANNWDSILFGGGGVSRPASVFAGTGGPVNVGHPEPTFASFGEPQSSSGGGTSWDNILFGGGAGIGRSNEAAGVVNPSMGEPVIGQSPQAIFGGGGGGGTSWDNILFGGGRGQAAASAPSPANSIAAAASVPFTGSGRQGAFIPWGPLSLPGQFVQNVGTHPTVENAAQAANITLPWGVPNSIRQAPVDLTQPIAPQLAQISGFPEETVNRNFQLPWGPSSQEDLIAAANEQNNLPAPIPNVFNVGSGQNLSGANRWTELFGGGLPTSSPAPTPALSAAQEGTGLTVGAANGPAAVRYNNPGAQYPVLPWGPAGGTQAFGSPFFDTIDAKGNQIAYFPNVASGLASNANLLSSPQYVNHTISQIANTWSGGGRQSIAGYDPNMVVTPQWLATGNNAVALVQALSQGETSHPQQLTPQDIATAAAYYQLGSAPGNNIGGTYIPWGPGSPLQTVPRGGKILEGGFQVGTPGAFVGPPPYMWGPR